MRFESAMVPACRQAALRLANSSRALQGVEAGRNSATVARSLRTQASVLSKLAESAQVAVHGNRAIKAYARALARQGSATSELAAAIGRRDRSAESAAGARLHKAAIQVHESRRAAGLASCFDRGEHRHGRPYAVLPATPLPTALQRKATLACLEAAMQLAQISRQRQTRPKAQRLGIAERELAATGRALGTLAGHMQALGRNDRALAAYAKALNQQASATSQVAEALRRRDRTAELRAAVQVRAAARRALKRQTTAGLAGCGTA
jgi:hypothetical protein